MDRFAPAAAQALTRLDGYLLRPLGVDDFALVEPLLIAVPPELFSVPRRDEGFRAFVDHITRAPWTLPFICIETSAPVGVFFLNVGDVRLLNAYLVALMRPQHSAAPALALYIRHVFWSLPLHRLITHVPATPAAQPYSEALVSAGFKDEGTLKDHLVLGGAAADVRALGLLRADFSAWCAEHDPRLCLE